MRSRFGSAFILLTALSAPSNAQAVAPPPQVVARALDLVRAFQLTWQREWIRGQREQHGRMNHLPPGVAIMGNKTILVNPRAADLYCYFGPDAQPPYTPDHAWGLAPTQRKIASAGNKSHWTCPNWLPPDDYYVSQAVLGDERLSIDNALEPDARPRIHSARGILVGQLRTALHAAPKDSVLFGQYIRMLVDNDELATALFATDNCQSRPSWCLSLRGYVQHRMGAYFDAEDSFVSALNAMSPDERCRWADVRALLSGNERTAYASGTCAERDTQNQTLWWLADPLWSAPGNDRLSEQFARRVTVALHAALGRDERYNWTPAGGGDALAETVERYGWMSYTYWYNTTVMYHAPGLYAPQKEIDKYEEDRKAAGFRTTYEYSLGRVHVIPPMSMVAAPFDIKSSDWSTNAPGGDLDFSFKWWPVEHYPAMYPIVSFVDQQIAFLRRQDSVLIAYATSLARTDLQRKLGDTVRAVLLASTGPRTLSRLGEARVAAQSRLTFLAALPAGPSLVSVEVPWTARGDRAGRSRFGVKPPLPLSALRPGEASMSDPVILVVPPNAEAITSIPDSAVALMQGSTALNAGTRSIGVYWETYGITPADSVDITVTLQTAGGGSAVTSSWSEPQPGRVTRTAGTGVPIQMRSVVLDIGSVPIGTYTLVLTVMKRGGAGAMRTSREFAIR